MERYMDVLFKQGDKFPLFFDVLFLSSSSPKAENQPKRNAKEACN